MIDGLRPYAEIKPSGLPWLGDVPAHWDVRRNGRLFGSRRETEFPELPVLEVSLRSGVRVRDFDNGTRKQEMGDPSKYQRAARGDIAYNMMRMWQGAVGIAPVDGLVSPAYVVARPLAGTDAAYYAYVFRTAAYMREVDTFSRGIVPDRNRLYWESFKQMPSVYPPLDEQRLIVRFLDWHGAQAAKLIRAKKKIIALLNEQKQAIIDRAVTRGLDPNARLKPSGITWLGDLPQGWEVRALKRASNRSSLYGANIPSEKYAPTGVRFLRTTDIGDDGELRPNGVFISEAVAEGYVLNDGDFIISRSGTVGRAFVYRPSLHGPCAYAGYLVRFILNQSDLIPEYLWFLTKSSAFQSFLKSVSIASTIENVNGDKYANMPVALPPIGEQAEILATVHAKTAPLDTTMKRVETEISLFREFRTRLIADVVTGKLDVRAAAASLPETAELEATDELVEDDDLIEPVDDAENEEVAS